MCALSPTELTRYSRHVMLAEIGLSGQERLRAARVLVVGAGGLGSPAALYLAAAGVGTIGLADFDCIEAHNLQRQILHDEAAVGVPKTRSGAERLRALNGSITVREHPEGVLAGNALDLFHDYDVIVDGTDNFSTRYLNNDAAVLAARPLVYGSIFRFSGQVTVLAPHLGGPCHRCLFPRPPAPGSVPSCGEAGVLGALCGVIGSLQAMEAIKLIAGFGKPLIGRLLTYDALNQEFDILRVPRDDACAACGRQPRITRLDADHYTEACAPPPLAMPDSDIPLEITVQEAAELHRAQPEHVHLLDVREPFELAICQIDGARHIPMRQIPEQLENLPKDERLLVLCHHGGRSLRVTEYLRENGFAQASNVAGGIDAWAQEIAPGMRRY